MKVWWITYYNKIQLTDEEHAGDVIRISSINNKYNVWKVDSGIFYHYTFLNSFENLEAAIMYGLNYIEEKEKYK